MTWSATDFSHDAVQQIFDGVDYTTDLISSRQQLFQLRDQRGRFVSEHRVADFVTATSRG